jgi:hypothetical protein
MSNLMPGNLLVLFLAKSPTVLANQSIRTSLQKAMADPKNPLTTLLVARMPGLHPEVTTGQDHGGHRHAAYLLFA